MSRILRCNSKELICSSLQKPIQTIKLKKFSMISSQQLTQKHTSVKSSFKPAIKLKNKIQQNRSTNCSKMLISKNSPQQVQEKLTRSLEQQKQILIKTTQNLKKLTNNLRDLLEEIKKQFISTFAFTNMSLIGVLRKFMSYDLYHTPEQNLDSSIELIQSIQIGSNKKNLLFSFQDSEIKSNLNSKQIRITTQTSQNQNNLFQTKISDLNVVRKEKLNQSSSVIQSISYDEQSNFNNSKTIKLSKQCLLKQRQIENYIYKVNGVLDKIYLKLGSSIFSMD